MENAEIIISLAGTVISLIIAVITFIAKFLKSEKAKTTAENIIQICNEIVPLIKQAEQFVNFSGQEKKEYVMTLMRKYALDNGISFDFGMLDEKIDDLVDFTKNVNVKTFVGEENTKSKTCTEKIGNVVINRIL